MKTGYAVICGIGLQLGLLGAPALANASQFYVGAQATNLSARLDYGNGSETYNLNPTRVELGWKEVGFYWGVQVLTGGKDTDVDIYGTTFEMETDTGYGLFVGLSVPNFYMGLGLQNFNTIYRQVGTSTQDKSNIMTLGVELGIQHKIAPGLSVYADFSYYSGSADYPTFFSSRPDFSVRGFAGGIKYSFF